jgi:feruloyl-CoA synthase
MTRLEVSAFVNAGIMPADVLIERAPDGTIRARSPHRLGPYPTRLTDRLRHWAIEAPSRTFLARRGPDGEWRRLTYADVLERVRRVAQALLARKLSIDRTILILSGNSLEHQILALAAMTIGVPYAPIAPAYSLVVREYDTLRALVTSMRPALVFADDGPAFAKPLSAIANPAIEIVTVRPAPDLASTSFGALEDSPASAEVDEAEARVGADTIAKILYTSGSTGRPKGVINTQRMLCANLEQIRTSLGFLADEPPVLCDWLPWNHTFGGNHNVGIALYNGGTLYIDDGRPAPGAIETTIANLREIAPTAYFNVPKGYEMLLPYLERDDNFRRHFFSRLRLFFYAAAGIQPKTAESFQRLAVETLGRPIPWVTGLGSTESAPSAMFTGPLLTPAAEIGVPVAGLELKAAPVGDLLEARIKGPNVTPGYWRDETLTRASFDDEGFYRMGDAIAPVDPADLARGFTFQGRIAEDFKLSTGTWVRVGPLRARFLAIAGDLIADVAIAGQGHDAVAALLFPNMAGCRAVSGLPAEASLTDIVRHPSVQAAVAERLDRYNAANPTSSTRIAHAALMDSVPSIDAGEITDKGSLNQKAVLRHRAMDVDRLYTGHDRSTL